MSAFKVKRTLLLAAGLGALGLIGWRRKRLREWLALGPTSDEGWKSNKIGAARIPERAAPISVNSPRPKVGVAPIPTRNCGQLEVTNTVRRQILEHCCRDDTRAATVLPFPNWPAGFYRRLGVHGFVSEQAKKPRRLGRGLVIGG